MGNANMLCIRCKGTRNLCGLGSCPVLQGIRAKQIYAKKVEKQFYGPTDNLFVGENSYPNVLLGPLVTVDQTIQSHTDLLKKDYSDVINTFAGFVRSVERHSIKARLEDNLREIAMATNVLDVEATYRQKPVFSMDYSPYMQPVGATGMLERLFVCDNPHIPGTTDQLAHDRVKAVEAVGELYSKGLDSYYITKVLSAGLLGEKKKAVPTRWSITATDDMLSKLELGRIRDYPETSEFSAHYAFNLHNEFVIILSPGKWEFEQFEVYAPGSLWSQDSQTESMTYDHEPHEGKKGYSCQAGGYYAARLAVAEYLAKIRKQARVTVIRKIHKGYMFPLGVWEVRENAREAMKNTVIRCGTFQELRGFLLYAKALNIDDYKKVSRIMNQRRLYEFF